MPIKNDETTQIERQPVVTGDYDYFKVIGFGYSDETHRNGVTRMTIRCLFAVAEKDEEGNITGFTDELEKDIHIEGQALANLMFQTPTEATVYADVKAKIYNHLQTEGVFPAGTVE
jgi:hypothetical protein